MAKKEKETTAYKPKINEKVICEHKGFKYEARVLSIRKDPDSTDKIPENQFLVHYQGWNKNWDEWVGEGRVFQYNEVNIGLMKEQRSSSSKSRGVGGSMRKKQANQSMGNSFSSTSGPIQNNSTYNVSTPNSSQSSAAGDSIILDPEDSIQLDQEVKIKIPDELRSWLIDDDNCVKNKKLTLLPSKVTISMILKDFIAHKKLTTKTPADKEVLLSELTLGLRDYFNVMLGAHLLYKFERLQYQNVLKEHGKDVDLTQHYGVIHLVRLFTKIGRLLAVSTLEGQNMQTIVNYIQDILKFISKQQNLFDIERCYTLAPPDYIKNALK